MSLISRLFGRKQEPPPPGRDVAALAAPFAKPALHLLKSDEPARSYFGGRPQLPSGMTWPQTDGRSLTFLACIDLEAANQALPQPWLPPTGQLLFFYDVEQQPWGFDPKDLGGWAVLFSADVVPPAADGPGALPLRFIRFREIATYPSHQRPEISALRLADAEINQLIEVSAAVYGDAPQTQLGGWPIPIQGDEMEIECEIVSQGRTPDAAAFRAAHDSQLRSDAAQWRLLLQMDGDDELKVMWGDAGIIYFWIRTRDAIAGRFEKVHLVLQCC